MLYQLIQQVPLVCWTQARICLHYEANSERLSVLIRQMSTHYCVCHFFVQFASIDFVTWFGRCHNVPTYHCIRVYQSAIPRLPIIPIVGFPFMGFPFHGIPSFPFIPSSLCYPFLFAFYGLVATMSFDLLTFGLHVICLSSRRRSKENSQLLLADLRTVHSIMIQ